jgi:HK97 family phage major capsid protein
MPAKEVLAKKQERANLTGKIRTIVDEYMDKAMPGEKKEEMTKMEARFDELTEQILNEEKQLARERTIGEAKETAPTQKKSESMDLFAKALYGEAKDIAEYRNALDLGTDATAGSLTAPMEFVEELIKGLDDILFMRQICRKVGPIGAAQSLGFPYRKTSATDASWVAEVAAAPEETALDFGRREFKPYRMGKLIKVSDTLVRHAPMAAGVVKEEMELRINTSQENGYMNGDGSAKPLGVFTASASGISTGRDISDGNTTSAVTFDGLQNAKYNVKQQYMNKASWVLHRDLAKMLAKIKDADGQYIWQGSVVNGQPDRLLGAPVYMSEYAPNTFTTGQYVAMFGDFKHYWFCDADVLELKVLKELYAINNQIGYLVGYFGDGMPVLEEAFSRVKLA